MGPEACARDARGLFGHFKSPPAPPCARRRVDTAPEGKEEYEAKAALEIVNDAGVPCAGLSNKAAAGVCKVPPL